MLYKTKAIVLRHVKYGESSIIVTLYTEDHGRISCMVSGVRTKKPKFPPTLFQPLTLLDVDFYHRPSRDVQRIKDVVCCIHYRTVPFNYSKNAIALFLAEVLYLSLREEESNRPLFSYIFNALQLLDAEEEVISSFHHWFMLHLTRYLGFFPPEKIWNGDVHLAGDMQAFQGIRQELLFALKRVAESPQRPPDITDLSQNDRNRILECIIKYYRMHIDGFFRLRSFSVLQEVFGQNMIQ
jgi:DNA repair protein RecO (recombination protein O)